MEPFKTRWKLFRMVPRFSGTCCNLLVVVLVLASEPANLPLLEALISEDQIVDLQQVDTLWNGVNPLNSLSGPLKNMRISWTPSWGLKLEPSKTLWNPLTLLKPVLRFMHPSKTRCNLSGTLLATPLIWNPSRTLCYPLKLPQSHPLKGKRKRHISEPASSKGPC